ncbi:MAG: TPM domain-containing protein [Clostridia bacterium]|nr:TPM domain-containing protein [Clostridia bacterium]
MKKIVTLFITLIMFFSYSFSASALAVPNVPTTEAEFYAADYAGVLSDATKAAIVSGNQTLRTATGGEIVVVTVDNTDGLETSDYAKELGDLWGVGSAQYNNGIVLLLSIEDDDYYVALGTGAGTLVDKLQTLLDTELEPDFASKNYDAGVLKCFSALSTLLSESGIGGPLNYYEESGDYTFTGYRQHAAGGMSASYGKSFTIWAILFFVFLFIVILLISRSCVYPAYGYGAFPFMPFLFMGPFYRRPFFFHGHHHHHHNHHNHFGGGFGGGAGRGGGFGGGGSFGGGGAGRR